MAITTSKGSYQDYAYTGGMQSVTIPHDGIYKFEVWGAGGSNSALHGSGNYGNNYNTNGKGGYSVGYKLCKKGEVYYICVGGCNVPYNGGGVGDAGWGGGATHIATKTGELKNLSGNKAAVLLVAGGGGGTGQANGEGGKGGGWYGGGYGGTPDPVQAESIKGRSDKVDKATGIGRMAAWKPAPAAGAAAAGTAEMAATGIWAAAQAEAAEAATSAGCPASPARAVRYTAHPQRRAAETPSTRTVRRG